MKQKSIRYPVYPAARVLDRLAVKLSFGGIGFCPVCGSLTRFTHCGENLRETCLCYRCKANNRQRQLASVICMEMSNVTGERLRSLRSVARSDSLCVYNTEAAGSVHRTLSAMKHYTCSEYLDPCRQSGETVSGTLHQDLADLSFADSVFDLVISADVLEHVPEPYRAHREIHRVLKPNGRHVFTVPFLQTDFLDEQRTMVDETSNPVFLKEPQYHTDPLRPEGALVYTIFSLQMLMELARIGFRTNLHHLYAPWYGILGSNAIVFEAIKV